MPHKGKKKALKRKGAIAGNTTDGPSAKRSRSGSAEPSPSLGMQKIKTAIAKAKSVEGVLLAVEGTQASLSTNTLCQTLYAIAKFGGESRKSSYSGRRRDENKKVGERSLMRWVDKCSTEGNELLTSASSPLHPSNWWHTQSWRALMDALEAKLIDFDSKALTKSLWALATLRKRAGVQPSLLRRAATRAAALAASELDAKGVAGILWALARLLRDSGGSEEGRLSSSMEAEQALGADALSSILACAEGLAPSFNGIDTANVMVGLAKLFSPAGRTSSFLLNGRDAGEHESSQRAVTERLVQVLAARAVALYSSLKNRELVNIIWAVSTLRVTLPSSSAVAILDAAAAAAPTFQAQDIARTFWAVARLRSGGGTASGIREDKGRKGAEAIHGGDGGGGGGDNGDDAGGAACGGGEVVQRLLLALLERTLAISRTFNAQDVANSLWALAKLAGPVAGGAGETAGSGSGAEQKGKKQWAVAKKVGAVLEPLRRRAAQCAPAMNGQNLSNCLWALSKLHGGSICGAFLDAALRRTPAVLFAMEPLQVADALAALGGDRANHQNHSTMAMAEAAAAEEPNGASGQVLENVPNDARPHAGAALAACLSRAAAKCAPRMSAHDVAISVFAVARVLATFDHGARESTTTTTTTSTAESEGDKGRPDGSGGQTRGDELAADGRVLVARAVELSTSGVMTPPQLVYSAWAAAKIGQFQSWKFGRSPTQLEKCHEAVEQLLSACDLEQLHASNIGLAAAALSGVLAGTAKGEEDGKVELRQHQKTTIACGERVLRRARHILKKKDGGIGSQHVGNSELDRIHLTSDGQRTGSDFGWQSIGHLDILLQCIEMNTRRQQQGGEEVSFEFKKIRKLRKLLVSRAADAADALESATSSRDAALNESILNDPSLLAWLASSSSAISSSSSSTSPSSSEPMKHILLADCNSALYEALVGDTVYGKCSGADGEPSVDGNGDPQQRCQAACGVVVSRWNRFSTSPSTTGSPLPPAPPLPPPTTTTTAATATARGGKFVEPKQREQCAQSDLNDDASPAYDGCVIRMPLSRAGCAFALSAVSAVVRSEGGVLWLVGFEDEGILAPAMQRLLRSSGHWRPRVEIGDASTSTAGTGNRVVVVQLERHCGATEERSTFPPRQGLNTLEEWATNGTLALRVASEEGKVESGSEQRRVEKKKKKKDKKKKKRKREEPEEKSIEKVQILPWRTYPGLFAGGGLDIMTATLLRVLPIPPLRCASPVHSTLPSPSPDSSAPFAVLDYASGSGAIAAAISAAVPTAEMYALDSDSVAVAAARTNLSKAGIKCYLGDGLHALDPKRPKALTPEADLKEKNKNKKKKKKRTKEEIVAPTEETETSNACQDLFSQSSPQFDWIVSNPPVHMGLTDDFRVVRHLAREAPNYLRPGGSLWIVAQVYVPVGALLDESSNSARLLLPIGGKEKASSASCQVFNSVKLWHSDGRFAIWRASV